MFRVMTPIMVRDRSIGLSQIRHISRAMTRAASKAPKFGSGAELVCGRLDGVVLVLSPISRLI